MTHVRPSLRTGESTSGRLSPFSFDGSKVGEVILDSAAVWDGMAAANGKLFVSTEKGLLHCLAGK